METLYKANATTTGGRSGKVRSDDGLLEFDLSVPKSMGGEGGEKTNPEQLFAAGYSACYGSALQAVAGEQNIDLGEFTVTAEVSIGKTEEGDFQLSVILDSYLPGVDVETGERLVNEAHKVCPYSRATRDNIDVTLNLLLDD